MRDSLKRIVAIPLLLAIALWATAQTIKKPLTHQDYDRWKTIFGYQLSPDGQWLFYTLRPLEGNSTLMLVNTQTKTERVIERGTSPRFTADSQFLVCLIVPKQEDIKQAERERKKPEERPQNSLFILNLLTGEEITLERVQSFTLAEKGSEWIAYKPIPPTGSGQKPENPSPSPQQQEEHTKPPKKRQPFGSPLVLRNLKTKEEIPLNNVLNTLWSETGDSFLYSVSDKEGKEDGVYLYRLSTKEKLTLLTGIGDYKQLAISKDGKKIAFLSNRDHYEPEPGVYALYLWQEGQHEAAPVVTQKTQGMQEGWSPSDRRQVYFSDKGSRIYFGTAPTPPPTKPAQSPPEEEKPVLDIWNWKDPLIQPMQLRQASTERNRTFLALYDISSHRFVQLAKPTLREITVPADGEGDYAIGEDPLPYQQLISWDDSYSDYYVVSLQTGSARLLVRKSRENVVLSPTGRYAFWYDLSTRHWMVADLATGTTVNATQNIPYPLWDETNDRPMEPGSYGYAGWTSGDRTFVVYDAYDLWAIDPRGEKPPLCLTAQFGRLHSLSFRFVRLNTEERSLPDGKPWLLSAVNQETYASGFYHLLPTGELRQLVMMDKRFSNPLKAKEAEVLVFTRQSFEEFPDLWVSDTSFQNPRKMSNANPQQSEYRWGTAELIEWQSPDGIPLKGVLIKPEDFDYSKKYPMIVYIYERLSDTLHSYSQPAPSSASINTSFFVSRGYIVFRPDIVYEVGFPGESALKCVVSGVQAVLERGYVDPKRIGIQGHSWGGYETTFIITRTNLFACAVAGAPVANMFSAYGGIRWGSGMVRQFQYEKTQSRIGGSIWEYPMRFFANSPLFTLDRVQTPLLILHNDNDGAVPWYQGIELFTALRRLGKPVWMINYNGEDHGINKLPNRRDWSVRMQQFFDHYLKGEPAPLWMTEGVPAIKKGETLGYETPPASGG